MKRIISVFALVVISAAMVFSQNAKSEKTASQKTSSRHLTPEMRKAEQDGTLHYSYKGGHLTNCMGTKWNTQLEDVRLKNGTVLTHKGVLKFKDGKYGQLKDGECIDLSGNVMDHTEAHAKAKAMANEKP